MIEMRNIAWDEVQVGATLPELTIDVTATTLARDVLGTRDLYPIHHDRDFARSNGARDIFLNTMWYQGIVGRQVTDWAGPESFLRTLVIAMRAHSCPGDTLRIRGVVTGRRIEDGRKLVDLDVSIDNQLQPGATTAQVTVELA